MTDEFAVNVRDTPQGASFDVRVQPRAKRTAILGVLEGRLRVALAAPPIDGRANDELVRFLADFFEVPRSSVCVLAGEHARNKHIAIAQRTATQIAEAFEQALRS
jgi:uncharacterized protein